jgi:hypothetical protein
VGDRRDLRFVTVARCNETPEPTPLRCDVATQICVVPK